MKRGVDLGPLHRHLWNVDNDVVLISVVLSDGLDLQEVSAQASCTLGLIYLHWA